MNKSIVGEYKGVHIVFNNYSIHITNSYRITDDDFKRDVIKALFELQPNIAEHRTPNDMFNEWKAHNILYQHHYQIARTKDVDFEYNQKKWRKIGYKIIALLLREKE